MPRDDDSAVGTCRPCVASPVAVCLRRSRAIPGTGDVSGCFLGRMGCHAELRGHRRDDHRSRIPHLQCRYRLHAGGNNPLQHACGEPVRCIQARKQPTALLHPGHRRPLPARLRYPALPARLLRTGSKLVAESAPAARASRASCRSGQAPGLFVLLGTVSRSLQILSGSHATERCARSRRFRGRRGVWRKCAGRHLARAARRGLRRSRCRDCSSPHRRFASRR